MRYQSILAVIAAACLLCAGCDAPSGDGGAPPDDGLRFGTPLSAERQTLYMQSCHACHRNAVPGIPRAGDPRAWEPRRAQGLDVLVQHAMKGFRGMPPMGMCPSCTEDDMRALVAYMAGLELGPEQP